jgi:hypothetical protein
MILISVPGDNIFVVGATAASPADFGVAGFGSGFGQVQFVMSATGTNYNTAGGVPYTLIDPQNTVHPLLALTNGNYVGSIEDPTAFRITAKSLTAYAVGSDLYNQGTVYAAQYSRKKSIDALGNMTGNVTFPPAGVYMNGIDFFDIPLNEDDMALITPNIYVAPAREGAYIVHRLTGPDQPLTYRRSTPVFNSNPPGYTATTGNTSQAYATYTGTSLGIANVLPNFINSTGQVAQNLSCVATDGTNVPLAGANSAHDDGVTLGVVIFRGLNAQQTITVKTINCLELVPSFDSPSKNFTKLNPRNDPNALAAYYACAESLPGVMAAKHNFLGSLLPALGGILSRALPFLAPIFAPALKQGADMVVRRLESYPKVPASQAAIADAVSRGTPIPCEQPMARSTSSVSKKAKGKKKVVLVRSRSSSGIRMPRMR